MSDTTFSAGTVVASTWLNDVNVHTYKNIVNIKQSPYNAVGDGVTDDSAAFQAALTAGKSIFVPPGTYVIKDLYFTTTGQRLIGAGKQTSILKLKAGSTYGISTQAFGVRADAVAATYNVISLEVSNIGFNLDSTTDVITVAAIALEDTYDVLIDSIYVTDSNQDAANRWGVKLGRAIYDTKIKDSFIGRMYFAGNSVNAPANFGTTVFVDHVNGWHVRGDYYQIVIFDKCTYQKDDSKFRVGSSCAGWSITNGDYEGGGYLVRSDVVSGAANFFIAGNTYGGFKGTLFGGTGGRPNSMVCLDEYEAQGTRDISSITRSGTTATVVVPSVTYIAGNGFLQQAPPVGSYVLIAGCGAPFDNATGAEVLTSDSATNTFTYAVANSGATTGTNGTFIPDNSRNYRYIGMFAGRFYHDPVASRFIIRDRIVMDNQKYLTGFKADGTTEVTLLGVDSVDRLRLGDGSVMNIVDNGDGNLRNTRAGKGFMVTSPDGLTTKTITINNAGVITAV